MKKIYFVMLMKVLSLSAFSQTASIYFDDGLPYDAGYSSGNAFKITTEDTAGTSLWQIGTPQKTVFDTAASLPFALLTDTLHPFPADTQSVFYLSLSPRETGMGGRGIVALRWLQKLDMTKGEDYGKVQLSLDGGSTFNEVFNNSMIYNYFGYSHENIDTLQDASLAFSGTDTVWRDIWFCLYSGEIRDTVILKFTFSGGSNTAGKDGWMIDNFRAEYTIGHTVREMEGRQNLSLYPNPAGSEMTVALREGMGHQYIKNIELVNAFGQAVHSWDFQSASCTIDVSPFTAGYYKLLVTTDKKQLVVPAVIQH